MVMSELLNTSDAIIRDESQKNEISQQTILRIEYQGAYSYDYNDGIDMSDGGGLSKCFHGDKTSLKHYSKRYRTYHPKPYVCRSDESHPVDSDCFYSMNTYPRGKLVIISETLFHPDTKLHNHPRLGAEKDVERLTKLFLDLGFTVIVLDGLRKREILKEMQLISQESFDNLSCFACAISSHGGDGFFYAFDGQVQLSEITELFTQNNLIGKPRLFFIQTCQGSDFMESYEELPDTDIGMTNDRSDTHPEIPVQNFDVAISPDYDFVYAYAVAKGFRSWRNDKSGSWFVRILCEVISKYADKLDVLKILNKVNNELSFKRTRTIEKEANNKRQISSAVSTLTKEFYFFSPR